MKQNLFLPLFITFGSFWKISNSFKKRKNNGLKPTVQFSKDKKIVVE